jgi:hypothetical protein
MQNYGTLQLYRQSRPTDDQRVRCALLCLGITTVGVGVFPVFVSMTSLPGLLIIFVFSVDHWLVDIALSSRVARWQWAFIAAVLGFGVAWFLLRNGPLSAHVVPQIVRIRSGMSMIHFIYSARIWKLSDPQIRAAIGRDLFPVRDLFAVRG